MKTINHAAQVRKLIIAFFLVLVILISSTNTYYLLPVRAQEAESNTPVPEPTEESDVIPTPTSDIVPLGSNCGSPQVFDDQWSSGFRLVCQNNLYVLLVDLTNPAIKVEVKASPSGNHTLDWYADSNTVAIINADYQYSPCPSGAICSNGLTISNGSAPTNYTNIQKLCNDAWVRREIGFSQDGRPLIDWWYKFVSDSQARSWCSQWHGEGIPNGDSGGGKEQFSYNLVGAGPQFTFDGAFRWVCGDGSQNHDCPGSDVVINGEHFKPGTWWQRYQSAIGYSSDGTTLVLAESNNATHTIQDVHDIMYQRLSSYGKTLKNAFKFDGGSVAGFWYYNSTYHSTPGVNVPNVIRIQRTNSTCYSLSTNINPGGSGNISINTSSNCAQGKYSPGTSVQLSANPNGGYNFSNWSGDASGNTNNTTVVMNSNKNVTANFSPTSFTLNMYKSGTGSGTVTSNPAGINCGSTCSYAFNYNTVVTLTANPTTPSTFGGWSGGGCSGTGTCTVTMSSAQSITATFNPPGNQTLTIGKNGTGSGTVTSNPAGINCGSTCSYAFNYNTIVTLIATSSPDSTFTGWNGGGCSGTVTCEVTMDAAKSVAATFIQDEYTLTIVKHGNGTVSRSPDQLTYHYGDEITLSATPDLGWSFGGWSANVVAGIVTINDNTSVNATFTQNEYTLTINKGGNGTVSQSPNKLTYHYGEAVTLTATPDLGWTFGGWSANVVAGIVTINGNTTVDATFAQDEYTLTIVKQGNGTVSRSPEQLTYHYGDKVTLSATPDLGWSLGGWSANVVAGIVTINSNITVDATFIQDEYALTIVKQGNGTVSRSPDQLTYHYGEEVTLTATPDPGWSFESWSANVVTGVVTITGNTTVTANFIQAVVDPGIWDDADNAWIYTSTANNWVSMTTSAAHNGGYRYSNRAGSSATILINGPSFSLLYTAYSIGGVYEVFIDNLSAGTFDTYSPTTKWKQTWNSPVLTDAIHTVRLMHKSGSYVILDAIKVWATPLTLPAAITTLSAVTGSTDGSVDLAWTAVGSDGATGTATGYELRYSPAAITSEALWSTATIANGAPTPQVAGSSESMTITGLSPNARYYFAVRAINNAVMGGLSNSPSAIARVTASGSGTYDDTHPFWTYASAANNWSSLSSSSAFSGGYRYSNRSGSSATFLINSQRFSLVYTAYSIGGAYEVFIDNLSAGTIDTYSPTTKWKQVWNSPVLSAGVHTVRFVHKSGSYVILDAIKVWAAPFTIPAPITSLAAVTGTTNGTVDLSWTAVGNDGMTGSASSYLVRYSTAPISSETNWNSASTISSGVPVPAPAGSPESMTVTGLTPGTNYFFAVRAVNTEPAIGGLSNSPSAFAKTATLGLGTWDDSNSAWIYTSPANNWISMTTSAAYNSGYRFSNRAGSSATIFIDGSSFSVIYTAYSIGGVYEVFIDGASAGTFDTFSLSTKWKQSWDSPALTAGVHTVRLVHRSGSYIILDAIQVK